MMEDDAWYNGWRRLWQDNEPFDEDEEYDIVYEDEIEEPEE